MDMEKSCPVCRCDCYRDEADVGVGVLWHGPWRCVECGWYDGSRAADPQHTVVSLPDAGQHPLWSEVQELTSRVAELKMELDRLRKVLIQP